MFNSAPENGPAVVVSTASWRTTVTSRLLYLTLNGPLVRKWIGYFTGMDLRCGL